MGINFSSEIRLGDILVIISFIGMGIAAFYHLKEQINQHVLVTTIRLDWIDAAIEDSKKDLRNSNVQDEKIMNLERRQEAVETRMSELAHWRGFVNPTEHSV